MTDLNQVLIIAGIERTSGCWEKEAARFLNRKWYIVPERKLPSHWEGLGEGTITH